MNIEKTATQEKILNRARSGRAKFYEGGKRAANAAAKRFSNERAKDGNENTN